ncbi:protein lin-54 homolog isoform X2 [Apostichopus japonicus]|uniref:protein lin-54 homolog isoform X2 n=1 Tax=Stichopus japonicus TaxID=307972 RepID=UPI003AB17FB8
MDKIESNNDITTTVPTTLMPQVVSVSSLAGPSISQNGVQQILATNPTVVGAQGTVKTAQVVTSQPLLVNLNNDQQSSLTSVNSQNHERLVTQGLKRPLTSTGAPQGPIISKVIIRNANANQPVPSGLAGGSTTTTKINATLVKTADGRQVLTDGNGRQLVSATGSPLKFVTVSQGTSGQKNVLLTTAPGSPVKPIAPLSKVPIAPISPERITDTSAQYQKSSNSKKRKIAELIQLNSSNTNQGKIALSSGTVKIISVPSSVASSGAASGSTTSTTIPVHVQTISPNKQQQLVKPSTSTTTIHPLQMTAAGKMPMMRIVSVTSGSTTTTSATKLVTTLSGGKPIVPSLPGVVTGTTLASKIAIAPSRQTVKATSQPRFIMPANTPTFKIINTGVKPFTQLPPGTTLVAQQGSNLLQGLTMIPSNYLAVPSIVPAPQEQSQQIQHDIEGTSNGLVKQQSLKANGVLPDGTAGRPRKPCNCTKSQCLKLYCDCFANGEFCHECNCCNCLNNQEHEEDRKRAIKCCLERNPQAFHPKIGKGAAGQSQRRHNKGCNCKRSGCLKNYCECYEAKIPCSSICKCVGCKNFEESPDRKSLMHLADAAEVRHQQQAAAKDKLSSQIQEFPERPPQYGESGERLPFSFITSEVAEATCNCLLAQADEAVRGEVSQSEAERMILEEFGRCLKHVIASAGRSKGPS